jgi:geranylgeranyl diphosphate synthase, type II
LNMPFPDKHRVIEEHLNKVLDGCPYPTSLYDPIRYIMQVGGKRIRPLLVLLAADCIGEINEQVMDVAVAVELLHNFTLVHDDLMDNDSVRRGNPTIHARWDDGTAILAGDAIIGIAYRCLSNIESPNLGKLVRTFTSAVVEVCEGQALDKELEGSQTVDLLTYEDMIARKTGRLVSMSAKIGAIVNGADDQLADKFEKFGSLIGKAFQIQDDLLDYFSTTQELGKPVGSDMAMHKSTYVTLIAKELLIGPSATEYSRLLEAGSPDSVDRIRELLVEGGVEAHGKETVDKLFLQANDCLESMALSRGVPGLQRYADWILRRKY